MEQWLVYFARRPRWVIALVVLVSLLAASQLAKLQIFVSPQALTIQDDPERAAYERSVASFGSHRISVIYLRDEHLFRPDKLRVLQAEIARIEALPFVRRTQSLFSVPYIRVEDETVHTDPFLDPLPETQQAADALKAAALQNAFVRNNLLSRDGHTMAVNVYVDEDPGQLDFDARVTEALEASVSRLSLRFERVFQVGLPYVRTAVAARILHDARLMTAAGVIVLLISLLVSLRRASGAVVPLLTSGLGILWTLGALAALGRPLNVMTAMVPVLLIVVGSSEATYLVSEYTKAVDAGHRRLRAVRILARNLGLTVGLTFFTTVLGFLSLSTNPIHLVREFSLVASLALWANFLVAMMVTPVYLRYLGESAVHSRLARDRSTPQRPWLTRFGARLLRHRLLVFALGAALLGISILGALSLRVNNSLLDYFPADTPIRQRVSQMHRDLAGVETFSIVLDARIEGTFGRTRYLRELQKIQNYLRSDPAFDYSVSFADYVALLNSAANDSGIAELPSEDAVAEALLLFVKAKDVLEYVSANYSQASILVRHNLSGSRQLEQALARLRAFIAANTDPGLDVSIVGESILTAHAADYLSSAQMQSLGLMLAVIFLVVALLFANPLAGLLAVMVNLVPLLGLFGLMGYLGIPLDTATTMIGAIALGVCVNHTLHFMIRYNQRLKRARDETAAVLATMQDEIAPMTTASIALAAGLGTFSFSSFTPISHFGLLTALVILLAYLANVLFTPTLLSLVRLITLWDTLSTPLRRELIRNCALFRDMRRSQVRRVILLGTLREFGCGEQIMRQGEDGEELFVLLDGSVHITTVRADGSGERVDVCRVGDLFGVAALMCGRQRLGTATACEPTRVLALDWARVRRIGRFYPGIAALLYRNLSAIIASRLAVEYPGTADAPAESRGDRRNRRAIPPPHAADNAGEREPACRAAESSGQIDAALGLMET